MEITEVKNELKSRKRKEQKEKCALSGVKLKKEPSLFDAHRVLPKAKGGMLTSKNVKAVEPVAHMAHHEILRERSDEENELKILIDSREQIRKLLNSLNNRILAALGRKTDHMDSETEAWIKEKIKDTESQLSKIDRRIAKHLKGMKLPIVNTCLSFRGLGPITVAYLITYVDIAKARYASSLWSYTGLDKASHERYTKGEAGGGNKTLRTVLYTTACSMIKTKAVYTEVYNNEKAKLSASEKITTSRNTQGKLIQCAWKDTKLCHRHGAAIRKMIKHFLADFWYVWRTLEGLDTPHLYVEEKLGHTGIVKPEERGWIF